MGDYYFDATLTKTLYYTFLAIAFTLSIIYVIRKYLIKNEEKTLGSILHVALIVALMGSVPFMVQLGESIGDGWTHEINGNYGYKDFIEYEVVDRIESRRDTVVDSNFYNNFYESVCLLCINAGVQILYFLDKMAYTIRDFIFTMLVLIGPLVLAMGLYDAHKGKILIFYGLLVQASLWIVGWLVCATILHKTLLRGGSYQDADLVTLAAITLVWIVWCLIYFVIVIIGIQKFWEMGLSVGGAGPSFGGGVGKAAQTAATGVRTGAAVATGAGVAALAAGAGAKALGGGGVSLAKKSINRVRRGGIITPRPTQSNIIT